jgi:hypothetical protein
MQFRIDAPLEGFMTAIRIERDKKPSSVKDVSGQACDLKNQAEHKGLS